MELEGVMELASVADWFQITEVASVLEEMVKGNLKTCMCWDVMKRSNERGLILLENVARKLALERFEELAKTDSFVQMGEEALGRLLEDDDLAAKNEEAVWEAVAEWRRAKEGQSQGHELVGKI
jgi:hypothetical protein